MGTEISRKVIVVDTNFIVELKDNFQKTIEKLSENHDVFVTEISIDERISHKYLELEKTYQKLYEAQKEFKGYATICITKPFEEKVNSAKAITKKAYSGFFGDKIIPFISNNETMHEVMERVYRKIPPFSSAQGSSDKGFKDTLLWMSTIHYFEEYHDNAEVIFITSDKGFINNETTLITEFSEKTKKKIEIKTNDYYKILLGEDVGQPQINQITTPVLTDKEKQGIRLEITEVFNSICYTDVTAWNGDVYPMKNFDIFEKIDVFGAEDCFEKLKELMDEHIFDECINPSDLFFVYAPNIENIYKIPIDNIEKLYTLFQTIKTRYSNFLAQFFKTACEKINENYKQREPDDSDDLPF